MERKVVGSVCAEPEFIPMSPVGLFTMSALSHRHEANMCPLFIFVLTLRQEKDACVPS